jgi:hypothetical protein
MPWQMNNPGDPGGRSASTQSAVATQTKFASGILNSSTIPIKSDSEVLLEVKVQIYHHNLEYCTLSIVY